MRKHDNSLLHSATDLNAYLGCPHAVSLSLRKLIDPGSLPDRAPDDEEAQLIARAGIEHEEAYLQGLKADADVAEIANGAPLDELANTTFEAMSVGSTYIYQAVFLDAPWHGFVDFLKRVEEPSRLGAWSYETVDTKLARSPKAKHLVQLSLWRLFYKPVMNGSTLRRLALRYRNCARGYLAEVMQGESAFAEIMHSGRHAVAHLRRRNDVWTLEGIFGRDNTMAAPELRAPALSYLSQQGVVPTERPKDLAGEWAVLRRNTNTHLFAF